MKWCPGCGEQYHGAEHNCGYATVRKDRLRELERAEKRLREIEEGQSAASG